MFQYYLQLPSNVRMLTIDEMEVRERCRMTRCSTLCNTEAKASKKYVHEVRYHRFTTNITNIKVIFDENELHGFSCTFVDVQRSKHFMYQTLNDQVLSLVAMDNSIDLVQFAFNHFKNLLQSYQKSIKVIFVENTRNRSPSERNILRNIEFEIESLDNLECLHASGPLNVSQILSKTRKPLKTLYVEDRENVFLPMDYDKIFQVQQHLILSNVNLDSAQFSKLSAREVEIFIEKLTIRDVFNFIRSWQDGSIGRNIDYYRFKWEDSNFDKNKLLRMLRVPQLIREENAIEIKHFNEPGKMAILYFSESCLDFAASS